MTVAQRAISCAFRKPPGTFASAVSVNDAGHHPQSMAYQRAAAHLALFGAADGTNAGDVGIPLGILLGDTNNSGTVSATDVSQTKSQAGQTITPSNFRTDVNANGGINATDVGLVKSQAGAQLPP